MESPGTEDGNMYLWQTGVYVIWEARNVGKVLRVRDVVVLQIKCLYIWMQSWQIWVGSNFHSLILAKTVLGTAEYHFP